LNPIEKRDEGTITMDTIIHAPIENVWKAWTDPSVILSWFGSDSGGKGLQANLDVRPGGRFKISFANADHAEHTCFGVYDEVKEFSKLSFSWEWKSEPGVVSFVTLLLTPENNITRMHFEHAHVGNASKHDYTHGWRTTFIKLEQVLIQQEKW